jgi:hypothetical protein
MNESQTETLTVNTNPSTTGRESNSGVKDIARRDIDMAGHRIVNLGAPKEEGEFTTVDLESMPKRSGGKGSPGKSLLAAAADHVHPAGEGGGTADATLSIIETDDSYQTVKGTDEQLVAEFLLDLPSLAAKQFNFGATALVKTEGGTATFAIRYGGEPGEVDGKKVGEFDTSKRDWEFKGMGGGPIDVPKLADLIKITACNDRRDGVAHIRFKKVSASPDSGE